MNPQSIYHHRKYLTHLVHLRSWLPWLSILLLLCSDPLLNNIRWVYGSDAALFLHQLIESGLEKITQLRWLGLVYQDEIVGIAIKPITSFLNREGQGDMHLSIDLEMVDLLVLIQKWKYVFSKDLILIEKGSI